MFTIYLLNTMMAWRTVAMICCAVPVFTTIAMCFVSSGSFFFPIFFIFPTLIYQIEIFTQYFHPPRSLRPLNGYYPRIVRKKRKNRSVGSVVGCQVTWSLMSLPISNVTVTVQSHVIYVSNRMSNVLTHCQRCVKNLLSSNESERSNRLQSSCHYSSSPNFRVFFQCDHSLFRFSKRMTVPFHRIVLRLS